MKTRRISVHSKKNTPGSTWPGNGSIVAKLHSGSTMTRKSVNLTRNMTQSWVTLTPLFVKSDQILGHFWPRTEVWPQWTFFRVTLTRVLLECIMHFIYFMWRYNYRCECPAARHTFGHSRLSHLGLRRFGALSFLVQLRTVTPEEGQTKLISHLVSCSRSSVQWNRPPLIFTSCKNEE